MHQLWRHYFSITSLMADWQFYSNTVAGRAAGGPHGTASEVPVLLVERVAYRRTGKQLPDWLASLGLGARRHHR